MTSLLKGAPQESMKDVFDMATEKLYGASRGPTLCKRYIHM